MSTSENERFLLNFISVIQWYFFIVSYSLFRKIKNANIGTNQVAVYHTAEELANSKQADVESGAKKIVFEI